MFPVNVLLLCLIQALFVSGATLPEISRLPRATIDRPICPQQDSWIQPALEPDDCLSAIRRWSLQVDPLGKKPFEFLGQHSTGETRLTWQYTPVKYAYRSCTLAIAMPHDLDPGDLDLRPAVEFPRTDIASYFELEFAARAVFMECMNEESRPTGAWWSIGLKGGVGLFLWATGSEMDRKVHGFQTVMGNRRARVDGIGYD